MLSFEEFKQFARNAQYDLDARSCILSKEQMVRHTDEEWRRRTSNLTLNLDPNTKAKSLHLTPNHNA